MTWSFFLEASDHKAHSFSLSHSFERAHHLLGDMGALPYPRLHLCMCASFGRCVAFPLSRVRFLCDIFLLENYLRLELRRGRHLGLYLNARKALLSLTFLRLVLSSVTQIWWHLPPPLPLGRNGFPSLQKCSAAIAVALSFCKAMRGKSS